MSFDEIQGDIELFAQFPKYIFFFTWDYVILHSWGKEKGVEFVKRQISVTDNSY